MRASAGLEARASEAALTSLLAAASATVTASGTNVSLLATKMVDAYLTYASTVRGQATALSTFGLKAAPAVKVLLVAAGSFQLGQ